MLFDRLMVEWIKGKKRELTENMKKREEQLEVRNNVIDVGVVEVQTINRSMKDRRDELDRESKENEESLVGSN